VRFLHPRGTGLVARMTRQVDLGHIGCGLDDESHRRAVGARVVRSSRKAQVFLLGATLSTVLATEDRGAEING